LFLLTILFQRFKDNSGYFTPAEIAGFMLALAVMTAAAFFVFRFFARDGLMASLLAGLFAYLFFNGHRIFLVYEKNIIPEEYFNNEIYHKITTFLVLAALTAVIFVLAYRGLKRFRKITVDFFLLFLVLNLGAQVLIGCRHAPVKTEDRIVLRGKPAVSGQRPPNIYYIILDSYTSPQSLGRYWHYTDPSLGTTLNYLHINYTASATTRFTSTPFCLSSYLNMRWENTSDQGDIRSMYQSLHNLRNNAVIGFLKGHDYRIRNLSLFMLGNESPAYKYFPEVNLWGHSLFFLGYRLLRKIDRTPFEIRTNFHIASEVVKQAAENKKGQAPVFTYAHLLLPHSRYLVDHLGQRQTNTDLADKERYLEQLKFARKMMVYLSSGIIRNDPGSVIVIQGDHGFRDLKQAGIREVEAHSLFNSIYLSGENIPEEMRARLDNPVNNFRIILNRYFGTDLDLL